MAIENGNKLLTLGGLTSFATALTEKLGLKHNGKWQYDTYTIGSDGKATNLGDVLSHLYDQVTNADTSKIKNIVIEDINGENAVKVIFKNDAGTEIDHFIISSPEPSQLIIATPSNKSIKLQLSEVNSETPITEISNSDLTDKSYVDKETDSINKKYKLDINSGFATGGGIQTAEFTYYKSVSGGLNDYIATVNIPDVNKSDGTVEICKYQFRIPAEQLLADWRVDTVELNTGYNLYEGGAWHSNKKYHTTVGQYSDSYGYFLSIVLTDLPEDKIQAAKTDNDGVYDDHIRIMIIPMSDIVKDYALGDGVTRDIDNHLMVQLDEQGEYVELERVHDETTGLRAVTLNGTVQPDTTDEDSIHFSGDSGLATGDNVAGMINKMRNDYLSVLGDLSHTALTSLNETPDGPVCIEAISSENPDGSTNYRVTYDIVDESDMSYLFSE